VALNGKLFALGGSESSQVHASVEAYNMYSNTWTLVTPMTSPRRLPAAAALAGKIIVVGGWDGTRALSSCEAYNTESGTWETIPPMSHARQGAAAVAAASRVYVLGGWDGVSNARSSSVEILGGGRGEGGRGSRTGGVWEWRAGPALSCGRFGLSAAFLPTP
jgi:N-acetylneuraminic acid mutarotase